MARPHRERLLGTCAVAVASASLVLAGCTSNGGSGVPGGSSDRPGVTTPASGSASSTAPTPPGTPGPTTTTGRPGTLALSFADNGTSVYLTVGQRLHVVLATPFWTFHEPVTARVLRQDATGVAAPTVTCPGPSGSAGCRMRTADYTAIAAGRTAVLATRAVCGEAMRCTGSSGRFTVYVVVG